jgi:hypothetical protein
MGASWCDLFLVNRRILGTAEAYAILSPAKASAMPQPPGALKLRPPANNRKSAGRNASAQQSGAALRACCLAFEHSLLP